MPDYRSEARAVTFTGQGWFMDRKYLMGRKKAELARMYLNLRTQYLSLVDVVMAGEKKRKPARVKMQVRLTKAIKPYIVNRPEGGCQVLFPLTKLDEIVKAAGEDGP